MGIEEHVYLVVRNLSCHRMHWGVLEHVKVVNRLPRGLRKLAAEASTKAIKADLHIERPRRQEKAQKCARRRTLLHLCCDNADVQALLGAEVKEGMLALQRLPVDDGGVGPCC
jgi:hypothetical protein